MKQPYYACMDYPEAPSQERPETGKTGTERFWGVVVVIALALAVTYGAGSF